MLWTVCFCWPASFSLHKILYTYDAVASSSFFLLHYFICFVVARSNWTHCYRFYWKRFCHAYIDFIAKSEQIFRLFLCSPSQTCLYNVHIYTFVQRESPKKKHPFRYEQIPIDIKKDEIESVTEKSVFSVFTQARKH